ncbi:MAG: hypothetical protein ACYTEQ_25105 [Planctomycetota bacterium]|jgi:hypothetical protein
MTGTLQFVDLESVLKELKPGAVIQYVARNGTIAQVVFVGYEDWRAALEQVGQSAIDARVAKMDAVSKANAAFKKAEITFHRGVELHNLVETWMQRVEKDAEKHEIKVTQKIDDLREWAAQMYKKAYVRDVRQSRELDRLKAVTMWLGISSFILLTLVVIIGVT